MPITPRSRRARPARVDSDAEIDEDPLQGSDADEAQSGQGYVEPEADGESEADIPEYEEDGDEAFATDEEESSTPPPPPPTITGLKIKLKMPSQLPSSRFDTPIIESEDDLSSDDSEFGTQPPKVAARPLTTRQAVLASVLDSSHVSLSGSRQKKPPLNETELALRKEETARKRRNLTEKRLEDEKHETINRLLKKQSRPRNKRTTAQSRDRVIAEDATPTASTSGSRAPQTSRRAKKSTRIDQDGEHDAEANDAMDVDGNRSEARAGNDRQRQVPTMYRWVSSARRIGKENPEESEKSMTLTFSVPVSALSLAIHSSSSFSPDRSQNVRPMERPTTCSASGCDHPFRYRLVKDPIRGACGMACLKILEMSG